jgi:Leucine-rich repeat (LRR) protein
MEDIESIIDLLSKKELSQVELGLECGPEYLKQIIGPVTIISSGELTRSRRKKWPHFQYIQLVALILTNTQTTIPILSLSDTKSPLQKLPKDFASLSIETLEISNQKIEDISCIKDLSSLKRLILKQLPLLSFPKGSFLNELTYLHLEDLTFEKLEMSPTLSLEELHCTNVKLKEFPDSWLGCTNLKKLNLSSDSINLIPEGINALIHLKELKLIKLPIDNIPSSVSTLSDLKILSLMETQVVQLSDAIWQMTSLTELDLSHTPLEALPILPGILPNIIQLDLGDTKITDIPIGFFKSMNQLKELRIGSEEFQKGAIQSALPSSLDNVEINYTWSSGDRSCCINCFGALILLILPFVGLYYLFFT